MKKKIITVLLTSCLLMLNTVACDNSSGNEVLDNNIITDNKSETVDKLTNHMSEKERNSITVGALSILADENTNVSEHTVGLELLTSEDWLEWVKEHKDLFSEEDYQESIDYYESADITTAKDIIVDGRLYYGFNPPIDYDGGELEYYYNIGVDEYHVSFDSFEEFTMWYKDFLNNDAEENVIVDSEQTYSDMLLVFQSVMDGTYEILEKGSTDSYYTYENASRSDWEFDVDEMTEIADSVREISMYDEELDMKFVIHVTLPPDFDENQTYPMFVMTDGVWRFGNHPMLRKMMENSESEDVILVSIGYDYSIDGTSFPIRSKLFYEEKGSMLSFVTDNLMPYLNETYNIDFEHTGLYGHSAGGVFTHYAAFNSDLYENQPFKYYIIGSPAFWELFRLEAVEEPAAYQSEYGYFDRNKTFDKVIYVCGGENEDPDYEEYYGENDSTLEGIDNLMSRMESYGITTAECEIYKDSNHYEFIPSMFRDFFLKFYGKE